MLKATTVVMLPTNQRASICKGITTNRLYLYNNGYNLQINCQHLYFLSDEKIKEGDWYLTFQNGSVIGEPRKCEDSSYDFTNCKKIIATTDESLNLPQPSQSFLQKYVKEYNKGNIITKVMVEYEMMYRDMTGEHKALMLTGTEYSKLKINSIDNTITIRPIKTSWTREEVIEFAKKYAKMVQEKPIQMNAYKPIHNMKWIEENLH